MKELSTEEKARRYDEAIARANELNYVSDKDSLQRKTVEHIFPELAESEDEVMRKWLIDYLNNRVLNLPPGAEKEAVSKSILWLESQGEQKPYGQRQKCVDCQFNYAGECKGSCAMKRGEKRSDNKVEPKFESGDWIVDKEGNVHQVRNVVRNVSNNKDAYDLTDGGYIPTSNVENYHLWTIQDAKDGDVLAVEPIEGHRSPFVAIYKKQNEEGFDSYCFIGLDGKFYKGENGHSTEDVHPATKEQFDTLMKAMNNAGYEWDAEKKELKKIEQKPSEEYNITGIGSKNAQGKLGEMIKNINPVNEVLEQKPTWSEEDERMYRGLHNLIYSTPYCDSRKELSDWLNSLKDRIQPKQEWSEEDEENFARVDYACLKVYGGDSYSSDWLRKFLGIHKKWKPSEEQLKALKEIIDVGHFTSYPNALETLYEQLKKLK